MRSLVVVFLTFLISSANADSFPGETPDIGDSDACGRNCLYIALKSLGAEITSLDDIEQRIGPPPVGGYHLKRLQDGAQDLGFHTLGVKTTLKNLEKRPRPFACIAHYTTGHFVLFTDILADSRGVKVIDPPHEETTLPASTLATRWSGKVLLISPSPLIPEEQLEQNSGWIARCLAAAVLLMVLIFVAVKLRRRFLPVMIVLGLLSCLCGRGRDDNLQYLDGSNHHILALTP